MTSAAPLREKAAARRWAAVCAAAVITVDQLTKSWALESLRDSPIDLFWTLRLRLTFNSGAAFSLGTGFPWIFVVLGVLVLGALTVLVLRTDLATGPACSLGLVAGGAIGNLADRVLRDHGGAVVDFIDLQWWPVFNVADAAISVGVVLLLLTWRDLSAAPDDAITSADSTSADSTSD